MIGYLKGKISHIFNDSCFIDVNGVGYRVFISELTRLEIREEQNATLFTYLNVREDAMQLYGFFTEAEYDLFVLLISVSGIGPKVALGILSGMEPSAIKTAIASENIPLLVKLPGIGKKTAERLVLELKDKINTIPLDNINGSNKLIAEVFAPATGILDEVIQALKGLGYNEAEVRPIAEVLAENFTDVSALLKATLTELGKKK